MEWFLTVMGVTLIISQSSIFHPVREFFQHRVAKLYSLLTCPMCTGFWVGFIGSAAFGFGFHTGRLDALPMIPIPGTVLSVPLWYWMAHGAMGSFVCWAAHVVLVKLGQTRMLSSAIWQPETIRLIHEHKEPERKASAVPLEQRSRTDKVLDYGGHPPDIEEEDFAAAIVSSGRKAA